MRILILYILSRRLVDFKTEARGLYPKRLQSHRSDGGGTFVLIECPGASDRQMGAMALNQQLTVVLPMHNNERQIRSSVHDILDLVVLTNSNLDLVIVDDGSTDDTFEAACELARRYPRIQVLRQPFRSGLASVLELVRNRLTVDMVIVHDGVSPIDSTELKQLLMIEQAPGRRDDADTQTAESIDSHGSRRFAAVRTLHDRMEIAHRGALGFTWLRLEKPLVPRRRPVVDRQLVEQSKPLVPIANYLTNLPTGFSTRTTP